MTLGSDQVKHTHRQRKSRRHLYSSSSRTTITMVAWLLCAIVGVLYGTDAIRPSAPPSSSNKVGRRPLRRLWYRRLDDAGEDATTKGPRRIPALDRLRQVDNTNNNNNDVYEDSLAQELSTLLEGIEALAHEVEGTHSFPRAVLKKTSFRKSEASSTAKSNSNNNNKNNNNEIKTVYDLREAILDEGKELRDVQLAEDAQFLVNATASELLHHDVVELIVQRFKTGSTPGNRAPDDNATLALSIEGGGTLTVVGLFLVLG